MVERRQQQIEESIQRYLDALETADRTQPVEVEAKTERLREKIALQLRDARPVLHIAVVIRRVDPSIFSGQAGDGALEIARRSRGTPRIANRLLRRVRDFAEGRAGVGGPRGVVAVRVMTVASAHQDSTGSWALSTSSPSFHMLIG